MTSRQALSAEAAVTDTAGLWFGIIESQAIHRSTFGSVRDAQHRDPHLHQRLEQPRPPVRSSETADEILQKATNRPDSPHAEGRLARDKLRSGGSHGIT
jgi:hypothetical protein